MTTISLPTTKKLFALSRNVCSFPKCSVPLIETSGTVTGEICHIRAKSKGFARYDENQTKLERNSFENLILMCRMHHKAIDSEPETYTTDILLDMKSHHESSNFRTIEEEDTFFAKILLNDLARIEGTNNVVNIASYSPGAMQAHTINIVNRGVSKQVQPQVPGSIGSDINATGYSEYLIKRYIDFATIDKTRSSPFHPGRFRKNLERKFKCHYRLLPLSKFDDLQSHLMSMIDNTILGKNQKAKGELRYSTFKEWCTRQWLPLL
jgi:hypothetical protein